MLVLVLRSRVRDFILPLVVSFDLNPLAISGQPAVCFNIEEFIRALWTFTWTFEQTTCFHTPTERVVAPRHRQGPRYRPLQFDRYFVLPISSSLRPNPNTYISSLRILGSTCTQSAPLVIVRPSSLPSLRPCHLIYALLDDMERWQFL